MPNSSRVKTINFKGKAIMKQFENFEIINTKHLENYKFKGVWALFGKSKITSNYRCLNVGKSSCIGKEINIDIFRMYNFKKKEDKEKNI